MINGHPPAAMSLVLKEGIQKCGLRIAQRLLWRIGVTVDWPTVPRFPFEWPATLRPRGNPAAFPEGNMMLVRSSGHAGIMRRFQERRQSTIAPGISDETARIRVRARG